MSKKPEVMDNPKETRIIEIPVRHAKPINQAYAEYVSKMESRGLQAEIKLQVDWQRTIDVNGEPKILAGETGESKQEKATRLGNKYLDEALISIRRIKNLASAQYELTQIQKDTILLEIQNAQREVAYSFEAEKHVIAKVDLSKVG